VSGARDQDYPFNYYIVIGLLISCALTTSMKLLPIVGGIALLYFLSAVRSLILTKDAEQLRKRFKAFKLLTTYLCALVLPGIQAIRNYLISGNPSFPANNDYWKSEYIFNNTGHVISAAKSSADNVYDLGFFGGLLSTNSSTAGLFTYPEKLIYSPLPTYLFWIAVVSIVAWWINDTISRSSFGHKYEADPKAKVYLVVLGLFYILVGFISSSLLGDQSRYMLPVVLVGCVWLGVVTYTTLNSIFGPKRLEKWSQGLYVIGLVGALVAWADYGNGIPNRTLKEHSPLRNITRLDKLSFGIGRSSFDRAFDWKRIYLFYSENKRKIQRDGELCKECFVVSNNITHKIFSLPYRVVQLDWYDENVGTKIVSARRMSQDGMSADYIHEYLWKLGVRYVISEQGKDFVDKGIDEEILELLDADNIIKTSFYRLRRPKSLSSN